MPQLERLAVTFAAKYPRGYVLVSLASKKQRLDDTFNEMRSGCKVFIPKRFAQGKELAVDPKDTGSRTSDFLCLVKWLSVISCVENTLEKLRTF